VTSEINLTDVGYHPLKRPASIENPMSLARKGNSHRTYYDGAVLG
jgi:hypothetical protein